MTRIEQSAQQPPVNREEMKQIVRRELFMEIFRRKLLGCLGMLVLILIITLVPAGFIAAAAARSGLVEIPLLSHWLYKPSAPTRIVRPFSGTTTEDVLRSIGRHAQYDIRTGVAKVVVTETELTTIASATSSQPGGVFDRGLRDAQAVIEPRTIELFAVAPQGGRDTTFLARLTPSVVKGRLAFDVREMRIGAQDIAPSIAQLGATYVSAVIGDALQRELSSAGTILDVDAGVGELVITILPEAGTK